MIMYSSVFIIPKYYFNTLKTSVKLYKNKIGETVLEKSTTVFNN